MKTIIIGECDWLRNDYASDMVVGGIIYPTLEQAYQAAKTKDNSVKHLIAEGTVREARKIGRSLPQDDSFDREAVMNILQRLKFKNQALAETLVATGNAPIVMEGYDDFWGNGNDGNGQNMMGEILQDIRSELQFIMGIDLDEDEDDCAGCIDCDRTECCSGCDDEDDEEVPTLKDAILTSPDEELASACQSLLECSKAVVSLLDANDYNAKFISNKTGVPVNVVEEAIKKVQEFQSTITTIEDLLSSTVNDDSDFDEDDEDEDDEFDSEWID